MPPPPGVESVAIGLPSFTPAPAERRVARQKPGRRLAAMAGLLAGPGVLAMLGENDGPSMLSYASSGATYGVGFFLPFILVTFVAAYVVQEMAMRIGAVSGRGYGELVFQRFGRFWGWISVADLAVTNLITLITEVIAIRVGMGYFGVPAWAAVACAGGLVAIGSCGGRYARWERLAAGLAVFNLMFVAVAAFSRPSMGQIAHALATWGPLPKTGLSPFLLMVASNIGATVTPWMLFFQQSATVDKGMAEADIGRGRINTALGAVLAAAAGCAALVAAAPLFAHKVDMSHYDAGAGFAQALRPFIGAGGSALLALALIEAGAVAVLTISASSAYAIGEPVETAICSFNASPAKAPLFHGVNVGIALLAGLVVLLPGAPLLAISLNANMLATILLPAALVFLMLLANDREVMGAHVNGRLANGLGIAVGVLVTLAGAACACVSFLASIGVHLG
ncbi:MAG TPA: divalent metal cation transporter [Caulobacteraceae bacterium]|jgi:Mn2+/Fe2+ NRAMP family transporter